MQTQTTRITALIALLTLSTTDRVLAQVIDFENFPNGAATQDGEEVINQYAVAPYNVRFRIVDSNRQFVKWPQIAKAGGSQPSAFVGCGGVPDQPAPSSGVCESFLTDDTQLGSVGDLEIEYLQPVIRASGALVDVDNHGAAGNEEWEVTAYNTFGFPVDQVYISSNLQQPCGGPPGDGTAVYFSLVSPTGTAEISSVVLRFSGTVQQTLGLAFDNFSPAQSLISTTSTACPAVQNSTGQVAEIELFGNPAVSLNQVRLTARGLPSASNGYFLASRLSGLVTNPGGSQGNICLSGAVSRFNRPGEVQNSGTCGVLDLAINVFDIPSPSGATAFMAGETWHFQCWYRDQNPQSTSNFSKAARLTFQ